jgi:hypothetical protein
MELPRTGTGPSFDGFLALFGFNLSPNSPWLGTFPSGPLTGLSMGVVLLVGCLGGRLKPGVTLKLRSVVTLAILPGLKPSSGRPRNGLRVGLVGLVGLSLLSFCPGVTRAGGLGLLRLVGGVGLLGGYL